MSSTMKQKVLEGALSLSLLTGVGGAGLPSANAQSSSSSSHAATYYVSAAHPDPNFAGAGSDPATGLYWMPVPGTGMPRLSRAGQNAPKYLGYDSVTKRSYLSLTSAIDGNIYSYTKAEGLVHVDGLPSSIVKVEAWAKNIGIYGKYADGASHGSDETAANAQSSSSSSHTANYYVSEAHPDPNFPGAGSDPATGLYWLPVPGTGMPNLARAGHTAPMYLGYDSASGRSYMALTSAIQGNIYSYKKSEGLVHVDGFPSSIVKIKGLASSIGIYGKYADGASHGSDETQHAPANPSANPVTLPNAQGGAPSITKTGSTWTLAYSDPKDGKQRTLQASRPHVKGYGIDFTKAEWSKPQYQTPVGMFVAKDSTGYRFITATPDPANPSKSLRVDIYPTLDKPAADLGALKTAVDSTGATFVDPGSSIAAAP
jgi:hypothetical protein